jgi:hypothetical protein
MAPLVRRQAQICCTIDSPLGVTMRLSLWQMQCSDIVETFFVRTSAPWSILDSRRSLQAVAGALRKIEFRTNEGPASRAYLVHLSAC